MYRRFNRRLRLVAIACAAGACLTQVSGCLGGLGKYASNFNPCGTILVCDPVAYRFYTSGYDGPGADPDIDPACTYPPFCGSDVDPFAP